MPHHDGSALHVSDLAPRLGDHVTVWLRASSEVRGVAVRYTPDGEPDLIAATRAERQVACAPEACWWRADVPVRNPVTGYRFLISGPAGQSWYNTLGLAEYDVPDTYDFRLVAYDAPPAWARDAVVYEIFPDRFARSKQASSRSVPPWAISCDWDTPVICDGPQTPHQLYRGDLDGIAEHLDHIAALGVDTIYLTPIFPAESNHRYNATSFCEIDPLLGGEAALARLSGAVHSLGMRLVGDITTNHCGSGHPWLAEALAAAPGSPERQLFYMDADGGYEAWLGHRTLPKLNWGSAELRRRFCDGPDSITARWLAYFDGWRVDVANMTGRCGADDRTHDVAAAIRETAVATRPDALVIAEHNHDFSDDLDRGGWHGTMNYAGFTRPVWSWLRRADLDLPDHFGVPPLRTGCQAVASMMAFSGVVSWQALTASWTIVSSHDTPRIRTIVGEAAKVEVAVGMMMTYPGTPMLFAGDEFGLTGVNGEDARTPMPWHREQDWDSHALTDIQRLVHLRTSHPVLRDGGLRWVHVDDDILVYLRESAAETLLICARRAPGEQVALRCQGMVGPAAAGREAVNCYGGAPLPAISGAYLLPCDGPTFQVWKL